jgi:hypothetical protein
MRDEIGQLSTFAVNFLFRESAQSAGTYLTADGLALGSSLIISMHLQKCRDGE